MQEVQDRPVSLAAIVTVISVPTLAVPPEIVAEVVAAGELASIVCAEDSVSVVNAAFELPAASVSVMDSVVAPAARSVLPSATVYVAV